MKRLIAVILALTLQSVPGHAADASDLVFADRTPWNTPVGGLAWTVTRDAEANGAGDGGTRLLLEEASDEDGNTLLQISEEGPAGTRPLSRFPLSAGDPVVVYFLENVSRDMAQQSGGSPFYIRNRIKDAFRSGGEVSSEGDTVSVLLRPFAEDRNVARTGNFRSLSLEFELGPDAAQPIRQLRAATDGPVIAGRPYLFELTLTGSDAER